ncbi:flavin reductase [Halioglobus sp. HI00S01]|uniref:flavin reductase family protein n=1 Tax=Halioglobus sp. HI00S01 TaxID=1822214 RepID=UPI0007C20976|nr:flavin reductase family protein [Halioglobus sp. HI00S01]KZX53365.1 flavin reductase [Halioglobus sp. HI00S01]
MSLDGRELRNALGRFATGVTVVTALDAQGRAVGMTANSFSSVSLDPALVLWSLQNNSDMYDTFANPGSFAINVLALDQEGLSNQYAKKGDHLMDEAHYYMGRNGAPILRGALVSFECTLHQTHEGGDHLIIVGKVEDVVSRPTGEPLLFHAGRYAEIR